MTPRFCFWRSTSPHYNRPVYTKHQHPFCWKSHAHWTCTMSIKAGGWDFNMFHFSCDHFTMQTKLSYTGMSLKEYNVWKIYRAYKVPGRLFGYHFLKVRTCDVHVRKSLFRVVGWTGKTYCNSLTITEIFPVKFIHTIICLGLVLVIVTNVLLTFPPAGLNVWTEPKHQIGNVPYEYHDVPFLWQIFHGVIFWAPVL